MRRTQLAASEEEAQRQCVTQPQGFCQVIPVREKEKVLRQEKCLSLLGQVRDVSSWEAEQLLLFACDRWGRARGEAALREARCALSCSEASNRGQGATLRCKGSF